MRELARVGSTAPVSSASDAARLKLLLLLPLVLALLGGAGHVGGAASVCETANCGKGNCSETPVPSIPPFPNYECHCDPGWSNALKFFPFSPCIIPNCSFNSACLKLNLSQTPVPPPDLRNGVICSVVSCGAGGACKPGGDLFSYTCECRPGYANLLNLTTLPCVNCFLGSECYALGLGPPEPAPAPSGDHGSPGPPAPPPPGSGTKGSVSSSPSLVQLLLLMMLVSVAMLQAAV